jgi:hypothetical protein
MGLVVLGAHRCSSESKWPYGLLAINVIGYGVTPILVVQALYPKKRGVPEPRHSLALTEAPSSDSSCPAHHSLWSEVE